MHNQPPHTVSVDHIVGRLLQLWRADCPITLSNTPADVMGDLGFNLEEAESRLAHTTKQSSTGTDIDELQHKLAAINEYLNIGKRLDAALTAAVEARRQDRETGAFTIVLHVEDNDPYQYQEGYFTSVCIYEWAMEEFGIAVPEWAPPQQPTEEKVGQDQTTGTPTSKYTDLEKEKHEVIIALLLEELAAALKGKYVENDRPNFSQLGDRIAAKCKADAVDINGMSKEKLRKKFSDATKTKARYKTAKK
jgi:hypothetical protein